MCEKSGWRLELMMWTTRSFFTSQFKLFKMLIVYVYSSFASIHYVYIQCETNVCHLHFDFIHFASKLRSFIRRYRFVFFYYGILFVCCCKRYLHTHLVRKMWYFGRIRLAVEICDAPFVLDECKIGTLLLHCAPYVHLPSDSSCTSQQLTVLHHKNAY